MVSKPNYNHQRAERNRSKAQKKLEKQQRREGDNASTNDTDSGAPDTEQEPAN
ncbi:hypothetical protein [Emcibacter sp. SYSU 3D8]|uniref:hypothetical protein n=1 Tax=Emcibacter sp. SYSU 3D8 TaxID=3133969 RepID=UPI0031FE64F2